MRLANQFQGHKVEGQGHVISLSHVGPMARKSKTNSHSITKIGRRVPNDTCYIEHQFQRQKVRVTGRQTQTHKMCHIFRTVRLKNFQSWCADGGRRPISICLKFSFKLVIFLRVMQENKSGCFSFWTQCRGKLAAHFVLLLFVVAAVRRIKMYILETGGGMPCRPNPAATLLVIIKRARCYLWFTVFVTLFIRLRLRFA